jgi:hypothetical protein
VGDQSAAVTILSNGAGNPQSITIDATGTSTSVPPVNYQGLWWKSPAGSESGWGINFAHQGDVIFATWFTCRTSQTHHPGSVSLPRHRMSVSDRSAKPSLRE